MAGHKPVRKEIILEGQEGEEGVFTVQELAYYLRMKPLTIYKHASGGKLPGFKVGSHWRFKRSTIDQWIRSQEITNSSKKAVVNQ